MRQPERIELSFLIEALHLSPDEFLGELFHERVYRPFKTSFMSQDVFYEGLFASGRRMDELLADTIQRLTRDKVGIMTLREFNDDTVDAWNKYVRENCWRKVGSDYTSIFEFVRKIGNEYLLIQDGKIYFRIDDFINWQHVTFRCGEDLFVAAMLSDMNIRQGYEPTHFQWDYILKSDFFSLNNLIDREKIIENHFHIGGSSPNVDLSWIYLMNHPFGQEELYKKFWKEKESFYQSAYNHRPFRQSDIETLVKVAAWIRLSLFKTLILGKKNSKYENETTGVLYRIYLMLNGNSELLTLFEEMESDISLYRYNSPFRAFGTKVDYAITENANVDHEKNNSYIAGERFFNYNCLKHIFSHMIDSNVQILFYLYLLIKHSFNRLFIQSNNKTGFHNFKEYNSRKNYLLNGKYSQMATNMAVQGSIGENHLEQLEIRIAPNENVEKMESDINHYDGKSFYRSPHIKSYERLFPNGLSCDEPRKYGDGTDKFFYVLHFIKQKDPQWYEKDEYTYAPMCREYKKREEYKKAAQTLMGMRERGDDVCSRVFGIDAASNEVNFRPENFGPVFRYLTAYKIQQDVPWKRRIPDLRKTYHVGEDFFDITDGLRAIYEAVMFLELSQGDRIGHGVALGIDVDKWYIRHPKISLPLQNKLDNIAWMMFMVRHWGIEISAAYQQELATNFDRLYLKLYEETPPGLDAYIEAWRMRGDDPECYSANVPDKNYLFDTSKWGRHRLLDEKLFENHARPGDKVYAIYHRYHFDTALKKRALQSVTQEFKPEFKQEYVSIVKHLQIKMRSYITQKGIAVESCPSSNFLISNLDEFKEIPTFRLFPVTESQNNFFRMNVCINTDDQGVFYTSLVKEYTMLAATMRGEMTNGIRKYSDDTILSGIKHLIDNSKQLCFRTGSVRNFGIRSDLRFTATDSCLESGLMVLPFVPD